MENEISNTKEKQKVYFSNNVIIEDQGTQYKHTKMKLKQYYAS